MGLSFKFAIASDLHIALPSTIYEHPGRFHLVEFSIPALEVVLDHLSHFDLDFLLLPGDLTQHGEAENHAWLANRLAQLPYPVYVIPGNHDLSTPDCFKRFTPHYQKFGYDHQPENQLYYAQEILPGVRLIGLNSNWFDDNGKQIGWLDREQFDWLKTILADRSAQLTLVTIHHNILEHMPNQSKNPLGQRYLLDDPEPFCELLQQAGVQLVFTGHLHVQDIAWSDRYGFYEITTGSLISYPHPYRVLTYEQSEQATRLNVQSFRVRSLPQQPDLQHFSREWMGDRSYPFVRKLLTQPPLNLSLEVAETLMPQLRYFWADLANGDAKFSFPEFPPYLRTYFEAFSDSPPADNDVTLML
ncbi:metallophosphoesterase [Tumidithrix elongata RA019]|uniref:Metallophosphoesterase n=1 Tax=Tumidithrix elongata BACA0141 TaxID=2716417 RepID=A0AAW9PYW5_9CYAN|nr:metallophosphoesterase [Tumidithrix elongata RA019]